MKNDNASKVIVALTTILPPVVCSLYISYYCSSHAIYNDCIINCIITSAFGITFYCTYNAWRDICNQDHIYGMEEHTLNTCNKRVKGKGNYR
jgi:hypothetical protein